MWQHLGSSPYHDKKQIQNAYMIKKRCSVLQNCADTWKENVKFHFKNTVYLGSMLSQLAFKTTAGINNSKTPISTVVIH